MMIDKFPGSYKKVINILMIIGLIAGAVGGLVGGVLLGNMFLGMSILFGMLGLVLGPVVTYILEVVTFAPLLLVLNIFVNLNKFLAEKTGNSEAVDLNK